MLKEKDITLKELMAIYQQKHVSLFKGHKKQLDAMLVEEKDQKVLTEGNQKLSPVFYRRVIKRAIGREKCSLEELARKDLNKNVKLEIQKMIREQEQDIEQEKKMVSTSTKLPLVIACRLNIDNLAHFVTVGLNVHGELLSLSNKTLCGQSVARDDISQLCNRATCPVCLRKQKSK